MRPVDQRPVGLDRGEVLHRAGGLGCDDLAPLPEGEALDLLSDDAEAATLFARLGRDDRRVEREHVGFDGDLVDDGEDAVDRFDTLHQVVHRATQMHRRFANLVDAVGRTRDRGGAALSVGADG